MTSFNGPDEKKIYMKVLGVKVSDIHDWTRSPKPCGRHIGTPDSEVDLDKKASTKSNDSKPNVSSEELIGQRTEKGYLVSINDELIALFKVQGKVYAIRDSCPHAGGPLSMGDIEELPGEGLCVRCPWHQWTILLETGQVGEHKGRKQAAVIFPVKVSKEGEIYIGFDAVSNRFFNLDKYPSVDVVPRRTW
ncbi:hypothetical protein V1264_003036 [Littorina saxatilis]